MVRFSLHLAAVQGRVPSCHLVDYGALAALAGDGAAFGPKWRDVRHPEPARAENGE